MRFVTKLFDEALHISNGHAEGRAGLRHHILFDHDASKVVGAVLEGDLADFLALGDPRTLDIGEIVQVDSREGLGAQVFVGANCGSAEFRMLGLEGPTNECRERRRRYSVAVPGKLRLPLFRTVLLSPDALQMFDAVLDCFHVSEHHGGR